MSEEGFFWGDSQVPEELFPKTAIVCLSSNHGGMEFDAKILARRLSMWSESCLLVVRRGAWLEAVAREESLPYVSISMSYNFSIFGIFKIRRVLRSRGIRLLVYFGSSEMRSLRFCLNDSIDRFVVRHGTPKSKKKTDFIHRFLWSKVTHHWTISEALHRNVLELFPVKGKPVFINYTGQGEKLDELPMPRSLSYQDDTLLIGQIARVERVKGQFDTLSVLKKLRLSGINAKVVFYGDGRSLDDLKKAANAEGLLSDITFKGQVPKPYRHLDKQHVFLYPSYSEGFGNAFTEAISSGIHCLCYENTCFPEYRSLGFSYSMVPNGDIEALVDRAKEIWQTRERQPLENREIANEVFSDRAEMVRLYRALY